MGRGKDIPRGREADTHGCRVYQETVDQTAQRKWKWAWNNKQERERERKQGGKCANHKATGITDKPSLFEAKQDKPYLKRRLHWTLNKKVIVQNQAE